MLKKVATTAASAAMLLSMVVPVMAGRDRGPDSAIEVKNDDVVVVNVAGSVANTGLNMQSMLGTGRQTMFTGDAAASSVAYATVNSTEVNASCCSLGRHGGISVDNDDTFVLNLGLAGANSGLNMQTMSPMMGPGPQTLRGGRHHSQPSGSQCMSTGDATSGAVADVGVNMTLVRVGR